MHSAAGFSPVVRVRLLGAMRPLVVLAHRGRVGVLLVGLCDRGSSSISGRLGSVSWRASRSSGIAACWCAATSYVRPRTAVGVAVRSFSRTTVLARTAWS
ncbi:hypothetical protein ACIOHC_41960 [Streptomyces sp. NPDC088252]|uniref:hypothetical protein n=1 Tax=Streptomyces sp. NPDC088252 TaxID=3365845 RepID=UPI0037F550CC